MTELEEIWELVEVRQEAIDVLHLAENAEQVAKLATGIEFVSLLIVDLGLRVPWPEIKQ